MGWDGVEIVVAIDDVFSGIPVVLRCSHFSPEEEEEEGIV